MINFTFPIENKKTLISYRIRKPFLQPLDIEEYDKNYYYGINISVLTTDNIVLYAMFDGLLENRSYYQHGKLIVKLVLNLYPKTIKKISQIEKMLEPPLSKLCYEDLDLEKTVETLTNLLKKKWNLNNTFFREFAYHGETLDSFLQQSNNIESDILRFVQDFLSPNSESSLKLPISAGDEIGVANFVLSDCSHNVKVCCVSNDSQYVNPSYYLWFFLKYNEYFNCLQDLEYENLSDSYGNVFLKTLNIHLSQRQPAYCEIEQKLYFPVSKDIKVFQGFEKCREKRNYKSKLQWKIAYQGKVLQFSVKLRNTQNNTINGKIIRINENIYDPNSMINVNVNPYDIYDIFSESIMNAIIANYEDTILNISRCLQIPSEILYFTIYQESKGKERIVRFEPLKEDAHYNISEEIKEKYNDLVGKKGMSLSSAEIPQNLNTNARIKSDKAMTWNEMLQFLENVSDRTSPGLCQTLISTAKKTLSVMRKIYTDNELIEVFQVTSPLPVTNLDYFKWLMRSNNSLTIAAFYHKLTIKTNGLDIIKIGARYNAGSLGINKDSPWLLKFYDISYPRNIGKVFNYIHSTRNTLSVCFH